VECHNVEINLPILKKKQVSLYIKREDMLHPIISGNKFRKLKYNLVEAKAQNFNTLLTFGGAYSNHIAATACAGAESGFKTIGVIRGEELSENFLDNPTLKLAHDYGMDFKFVSRETYRTKNDPTFIKRLELEFCSFYLIPEGGTNNLAVKGCEEILSTSDAIFDLICCSVGTGGTVAGIINSKDGAQSVMGFSALKGDFLKEDIRKFAFGKNWKVIAEYHFGGYAKITDELVLFINAFKEKTNILLDPIYTGKMIYGILDMVRKDKFKPGTQILAIHTGGLQGIAGMNKKLKKKNEQLIVI